MSTEKTKIVFSTGPFSNLVVDGYATVEDFDKDAGKAGECLEYANENLLYRGGIEEIQSKATPEIEALSGIKRATDEEKTAKAQARVKDPAATKVKPILEGFIKYVNGVKAAVTEEVWASIVAKVTEVAAATPLDASPSHRQAPVNKAITEKAVAIVALDEATREAKIAKLQATVPEFDLERDSAGVPEVPSLAKLIQTYFEKLKSEL